MNYKETLDLLYNMLPDFQKVGAEAYKPGLDRIVEFNRELGNPDRDFFTIHIAGTNGKGSVSHILASILQAAGYRVGLFTSPHLRDFRERIKVDGDMIPENYVVDFTDRYAMRMRVLDMSFFEAVTAMAFRYFADSDVEVAVVETGLGGRLDSTNIVNPVLSVITNIGFDHQAFLGDTLEKIAAEKAGIIKPGVPVVVGESDPHSVPVFMDKASGAGSEIVFADRLFECVGAVKEESRQSFTFERRECGTRFEMQTDLMGGYQCRNIATVLTAADVMNRKTKLSVSTRAIREGISSVGVATGLRGRWEIISREPLTVCDTGHNAHGLKLVAEQIAAQEFDKLYMVLGVVNDKDLGGILPLLPRDAYYVFTKPSVPRGLPPERLAGEAAAFGLKGETAATVPQALRRARELAAGTDMIFIGGSNFTVADIL